MTARIHTECSPAPYAHSRVPAAGGDPAWRGWVPPQPSGGSPHHGSGGRGRMTPRRGEAAAAAVSRQEL